MQVFKYNVLKIKKDLDECDEEPKPKKEKKEKTFVIFYSTFC